MRFWIVLLVGVPWLMCHGPVGCTSNSAQRLDSPPRRCALLDDETFAGAVDDCARHEPLSTRQLLAFVGEPDDRVAWPALSKTLSSRSGMSPQLVADAIERMRVQYSYAKQTDVESTSMNGASAWLYMWKEPEPLFKAGARTTSIGFSVAVLVENEHVVGISMLSVPGVRATKAAGQSK